MCNPSLVGRLVLLPPTGTQLYSLRCTQCRHKLFPHYKASRAPTAEAIKGAMPQVQEMVKVIPAWLSYVLWHPHQCQQIFDLMHGN